jgi:hypothetical protein
MTEEEQRLEAVVRAQPRGQMGIPLVSRVGLCLRRRQLSLLLREWYMHRIDI